MEDVGPDSAEDGHSLQEFDPRFLHGDTSGVATTMISADQSASVLELHHFEKHDRLGGLLHLVDRSVHGRNQALHVGAVKRLDESGTEADENFPRDAVGLVLQRQNVLAAQL